ncbi:MAG: hypothetical protein PHE79_05605 [Eubacteriales bacterium]|nr:hypothetical protein [Eubacteriales bacterium]
MSRVFIKEKWERGGNENGNRILRQFVPKGTDIGKLTSKELQRTDGCVSNHPRKILVYKTANEMEAAGDKDGQLNLQLTLLQNNGKFFLTFFLFQRILLYMSAKNH